MSAKHTPGPWQCKLARSLYHIVEGVEVSISAGHVQPAERAAYIATKHADAHLIAASPSLLAALVNAEAKMRAQALTIDSELGACRSEEEFEEEALWPLQVYEARAAIARATGGGAA